MRDAYDFEMGGGGKYTLQHNLEMTYNDGLGAVRTHLSRGVGYNSLFTAVPKATVIVPQKRKATFVCIFGFG